MSLELFKQQPMKMHNFYETSFFHMHRAPENATGEVILASLYRNIGFNISEAHVTNEGNAFSKRLVKSERPNASLQSGISNDNWKFILESVLESPKQPGQPKKKFIQLTPIVPDTTLYSFAARFRGNPWNPGALTSSIIGYGCNSEKEIEKTWEDLFNALNIDESDDVWARLISQELGSWRDHRYEWKMKEFKGYSELEKNDRQKYHIPAKRFVKDMRSVIKMKSKLTRRQWISLLESLVRLGTASHVLWICNVNDKIWNIFQSSLDGKLPPNMEETGKEILLTKNGFWRYGELATPILKIKVRKYIEARIRINFLVYFITELIDSGNLPNHNLSFNSIEGIYSFCLYLFNNRGSLNVGDILIQTTRLLEKDPQLLTCSKGITSNLFEFLRYSLGQRQTVDPEARNYDQGYWIRKKGSHNSSPWILSAGPVSLLTMAFCCAQDSLSLRTIDDFCRHLRQYGISINAVDLSPSGLSQSLRDLGIVIDSPDAEGGMVIVNPFENVVNKV